jgi:CRP/FNR family cyclic AMP-dependent transcriptional regulator
MNPDSDSLAVRDILRSLPFFQELTPGELERVVALGRVVPYPKEMILFREGDKGEALYVVLDGSVRVSKAVPGSRDEAMAFMERGSFFGEMALVDEFPRSATAVASQDCKVLFIDKQAFIQMVQEDPVIGRKILWAFCRTLSLRLRETTDRIVALSSFTRSV